MRMKWSELSSRDKRLGIGCLAVVILAIIVIAVAVGLSSSDNFNKEIDAVQDSMTALSWDNILARDYEAGKLEDGVAVLVDNSGAYWVENDVVYAANGTAKSWSPSLSYSPIEIDFDAVKDAVK